MLTQLSELYAYRDLFFILVAKEIRARYKGSFLGLLWTLANPLLMLVVYSVVFAYVMRVDVPNYSTFLFVGLLPWNYLASSILQGAPCVVQNASLVKKVYFPREVLPLSVAAAGAINYLAGLVVLVPALLLGGMQLRYTIVAFPVVLAVQTLLVAGLTLLVSVSNAYFRDLEHISGVGVTAWFFLTPVLYPMRLVPERLRFWLSLNPMTHIIEAYRAVFYDGQWPNWRVMGLAALVGGGVLVLGLVVFSRLQRRVAEIV